MNRLEIAVAAAMSALRARVVQSLGHRTMTITTRPHGSTPAKGGLEVEIRERIAGADLVAWDG